MFMYGKNINIDINKDTFIFGDFNINQKYIYLLIKLYLYRTKYLDKTL